MYKIKFKSMKSKNIGKTILQGLSICFLSAFIIASAPGQCFAENAVGKEFLIEEVSVEPTLIRDPGGESVRFRVNASTPVWGTGNFPESTDMIQFHSDKTNGWISGRIVQYSSAFGTSTYAIEPVRPLVLDRPINNVHVYLSYPEAENPFEDQQMNWSVFPLEVLYTKPRIDQVLVNSRLADQSELIVSDDASKLEFKVALSHYELPSGATPGIYERVTALYARHLEGDTPVFSRVWNNPEGVYQTEVAFSLADFAGYLSPGFNHFELKARGRCQTGCEEFSDVFVVKVFFMDFQGPGNQLNVCHSAGVVHLQGQPEGGYFSGHGVLGDGPYFDPYIAGLGPAEITYYFPIAGQLLKLFKTLDVVLPPVISGPWEVCRNSVVSYEISGNEYSAGFEVVGGEVVDREGDRFWIHWHGTGAGFLDYDSRVGVIRLSVDDVCGGSVEYVVDITKMQSPDSAKLTLVNDNLLVCSDNSAQVYRWYHNSLSQPLGTTFGPYFILPASLTKSSGDRFWVETAYSKNDLGCYALSEPFEYTSKSVNFEYSLEFKAYPNPCLGQLSIFQFGEGAEFHTLRLLDVTGRLRYSEPLYHHGGEITTQLDCSQFEPGVYVLQLIGTNHMASDKIFISK